MHRLSTILSPVVRHATWGVGTLFMLITDKTFNYTNPVFLRADTAPFVRRSAEGLRKVLRKIYAKSYVNV